MERMDQIVIENDKVRLELLKDKSDNVKKFSIFGIFGNQMEPFMDLGSNLGLFLGRVKRNGEEKTGIDFKFNKKSKDGKDSCLEFSSMDTNFEIKLIIRLKDNESKDVKIVPLDIIEFITDIVVKNKVTASFLRFDLHYPFKKPLDFVKVPHLRPKKYYIMGDHKLGTPAIILSKDDKSVSLIADVNNFLENRRYMMHMDMNHMDNGRISYGFRNYRSHSHVMFLSKPRKKLKFDPADKKDFKLSFFVRVNADESKEKTLREVTKFLWDYFGKPKLKTILPQTLPFEQFATYNFDSFINPSTFNGYREFEYNNEKCAGLIYRTGTGGSRGRFIKISSEEVENLIKHPIYDHWHIFFAFHTLMNYPWIQNIIGKGVQKNPAENYEYFWNQAWFLNVRTAYGLKGLGLMLKNEKYCEMADKMMNLAINSPMKEGFFPSICIMTTEGIRWIEGTTAFKPHHEYVTVDMALTGYWMLKYADTYDYRKPDILSKLKKSAENLLNLQLESGAFPTTIQVKENRDGSVDITPIKDILYETPGSSAIGMFLCEIYKATGNTKYLNSAKKIVPFLEKEILPINKWFDYETFFSCTDYALKRKKTVFPYSILARDTTRKEEDNFKDPYTLSLPQNTMSIYWTVDFLRCMHENTKEQKYLDLGSYVLDYLSTFQQLFNAPFLEFDGFGGFCSQNNDAEWSDTRQALNTWELMEFYFLTGEEMYLERAIAGMKSCYVLVLHEKNKQVAPGNFKWIDEDDYGANFENYGHQGFNHPVQGAVTIDWSWGSSTMAYIMLRNKLGDLFIDLEKCKAYGVNACAVQETDMDNGILSIKAKILPEMPKLLIKILALKESRSNFNSIKLINLSSKKEYIIEIDEEFDQITIEL